MKILLAVDGSAYTEKMLGYLASHDNMFGNGNTYTLITVQAPLPARARAAVGATAVNEYYEEESAKVTGAAIEILKKNGMSADTLHKVGTPGEQISKAAESGKFDLVVMGSHGHSALANLVMGSVATQVLAHCGVPVLLVR